MIVGVTFDRDIQILRASRVDDGVQSRPGPFKSEGLPIPAAMKFVSDGERFRANAVGTDLTARFQVRYTEFTAAITSADRLLCEGRTYAISGIKEIGRREGFEITTSEVLS